MWRLFWDEEEGKMREKFCLLLAKSSHSFPVASWADAPSATHNRSALRYFECFLNASWRRHQSCKNIPDYLVGKSRASSWINLWGSTIIESLHKYCLRPRCHLGNAHMGKCANAFDNSYCSAILSHQAMWTPCSQADQIDPKQGRLFSIWWGSCQFS